MGAAQKPKGILEGVRVLELAGIGPIPFCAMHLADLGADVVVVERAVAEHPAPTARLINRGKRSIVLDLKSPQGAAAALKLGAHVDIVLEGMRPGVAERLGLGPADYQRVKPSLVYGRMTGWGQQGPMASAAGHDLNYLAVSGTAWFAGEAGTLPVPPPTMVGDLGGGAMYLSVGVLAALLRARQTGAGEVVDAAIVDGAAHLSSLLLSLRGSGELPDDRGVGWIDGSPWYRCYRCQDGKLISVGALEPPFYRTLMTTLGLIAEFPPSAHFDQATWPRMTERLTTSFAAHPLSHWNAEFEGIDACVAPVLTPGEASMHPHLQARQVYRSDRGFLEPMPAPRFASVAPWTQIPEACAPGQHTEEILKWIEEPRS